MLRPLGLALAFVLALSAFVAVFLGAHPGRSAAATNTSSIYLPLVEDFPVTFFDDFSNPSSGWSTGTVTDSTGAAVATLAYLNGTFQILSEQAGYLIPVGLDANGHTGLQASDFQVSMQVWNASSAVGTNGFYFGSVPCQIGTGGGGFYDFEVGSLLSQSGITVPNQYYLDRFNYASTDAQCTGAGGTWTALVGPATSSAILAGNSINLIEVIRKGSTFTLIANGQQLAQVTDTSAIPEPGYLGLTSSAQTSGFDARFDNFLLVDLASSSSASLRGTSLSRESHSVPVQAAQRSVPSR